MTPALRRAAIVVAGLGLAAAVAGAAAWLELNRPHSGWEGPSVTVEVTPGLDARSTLDRLHEAGVVRRPGLARWWLVFRGGGKRLKAGEYRFDRPISPLEVLGRLERGEVALYAVTVPEGLRIDEVARRVADAGLGDYENLLEAFRDPSPVRDLDPRAEDLEGYLFPDTYHLPRRQPGDKIARTMVKRFKEVIGDDYADRAAAVGLTLREAVSLASMIEKETSVPDERGRISRVFHNRMDRGMKLQCDPTVAYALAKAGRPTDRLTYRDLEIDSPWNTYRFEGLPPGPICNPGRESLEASVGPDEGDDLYFVAAPEGGHRFSTNHRSHVEAVRDWRRHQRSAR